MQILGAAMIGFVKKHVLLTVFLVVIVFFVVGFFYKANIIAEDTYSYWVTEFRPYASPEMQKKGDLIYSQCKSSAVRFVLTDNADWHRHRDYCRWRFNNSIDFKKHQKQMSDNGLVVSRQSRLY